MLVKRSNNAESVRQFQPRGWYNPGEKTFRLMEHATLKGLRRRSLITRESKYAPFPVSHVSAFTHARSGCCIFLSEEIIR